MRLGARVGGIRVALLSSEAAGNRCCHLGMNRSSVANCRKSDAAAASARRGRAGARLAAARAWPLRPALLLLAALLLHALVQAARVGLAPRLGRALLVANLRAGGRGELGSAA